MKINWRRASTALAVGLSGAVLLSGVAGASTPTAGSGEDNVYQAPQGQGSDTTYVMMNDLSQLYNQSPGCTVILTKNDPNLGNCVTPDASQTAPQANAVDNWDHDIISQQYPTGSSAGIAALLANKPDVAFARSSRPPAATGETGANFWGYAIDGVAVLTGAGRSIPNGISLADLQAIWSCTKTTWGQVTGNAADTTPIVPYGMQTSSGTFAVFQAALGGIDLNAGSCVQKVGSAPPFENNTAPVLADAASKGINANNVIWWGSYGELKTYQFKRGNVNFAAINTAAPAAPPTPVSPSNSTILNKTYPITRVLYHVTKDADAAPASAGSPTVVGTTSGVGGAVHHFTQWLCNTSAALAAGAVNPYNGNNYFLDISNVIASSGFQRPAAADRSNGACELATA